MNLDQSHLQFSLKRILLLYDEAVVCLKRAAAAVSAGDQVLKTETLSRALGALNMLRAGLDPAQDPLLARNLEDLYQFSIHRIYDADSLNDCMAIEQAIQVLEVLRSAWRDIRKEVHAR